MTIAPSSRESFFNGLYPCQGSIFCRRLCSKMIVEQITQNYPRATLLVNGHESSDRALANGISSSPTSEEPIMQASRKAGIVVAQSRKAGNAGGRARWAGRTAGVARNDHNNPKFFRSELLICNTHHVIYSAYHALVWLVASNLGRRCPNVSVHHSLHR
jgi:hypothetical protein